MTDLPEEWRAAAGWEGFYLVSSHGRVWSVDRVNSYGRRVKGRILKPYVTVKGHLLLGLCRDGKRRNVKVHRLVATTFFGEPDAGQEVCHWDGNPANNHVGNLRWDTQSSNMRDRVRHGVHHLARRTHCTRGHQLVGDNLCSSHVRRGHRSCRACHLARNWLLRNPTVDRHLLKAKADERYRELMANHGEAW
jgi:hypothetical protein